ncbi:MAG: CapA family protein [Ignavibacteriae bacterium]|nr:CapA family protein [Ignavibacteriota bacterium]
MKIAVLGDIVANYVEKTKLDLDVFLNDYRNSTILKTLSEFDFVIGNLEAPITNSENEIFKTGPAIKNPKEVIEILKLSNINVVTLANNHIYDFGEIGLTETINICNQNGIKTVGAGKSLDEITKPLILEKNDQKIAVINFAENEFNTISLDDKIIGSNSLDLINLFYQISNVKGKVDYVIVISHGGHEQYNYPSPRIKKLYRYLIDLGADALIAHHPHVPQGYEVYNGKPIYYSTGNFIFPSTEENFSNHHGYVVGLDLIQDKIIYNIYPYKQCWENFKVDVMERNEKTNFVNLIETLSTEITNDNVLQENWAKFCETRKDSFFNSLFPFNQRIVNKLTKFSIQSLFVPEKHFLKILNLIRCESHKDILIQSIKKKVYR